MSNVVEKLCEGVADCQLRRQSTVHDSASSAAPITDEASKGRQRSVFIKSSQSGHYLSAQQDWDLRVDRDDYRDLTPQSRESFTVIDMGYGKVALRAVTGMFVSVQWDKTVVVNRTQAQAWEEFTEERRDEDGAVAFKSHFGEYLHVSTPTGCVDARCYNQSDPTIWFYKRPIVSATSEPIFSFKSAANGKLLSFSDWSVHGVDGIRDEFIMDDVNGDGSMFTMRCARHNMFLHAADDNSIGMTGDCNDRRNYFQVREINGGVQVLYSIGHANVITIPPSGSAIWASTMNIAEWEHVELKSSKVAPLDQRPLLPAGTVFINSNQSGHGLSAQQNWELRVDRDDDNRKLTPQSRESFALVDTSNGKIALKAFTGQFVSVQWDKTVVVNRTRALEWEEFTEERRREDGAVAFKSHFGEYLRVSSSTGCVDARGKDLNDPNVWFHQSSVDTSTSEPIFSFKSAVNGKLLSFKSDWSVHGVDGRRDEFIVDDVDGDGNKLTLRCTRNNMFLYVADDNSIGMTSDGNAIRNHFQVWTIDGGVQVLYSIGHANVITIPPSGSSIWSSTMKIAEWEHVTIVSSVMTCVPASQRRSNGDALLATSAPEAIARMNHESPSSLTIVNGALSLSGVWKKMLLRNEAGYLYIYKYATSKLQPGDNAMEFTSDALGREVGFSLFAQSLPHGTIPFLPARLMTIGDDHGIGLIMPYMEDFKVAPDYLPLELHPDDAAAFYVQFMVSLFVMDKDGSRANWGMIDGVPVRYDWGWAMDITSDFGYVSDAMEPTVRIIHSIWDNLVSYLKKFPVMVNAIIKKTLSFLIALRESSIFDDETETLKTMSSFIAWQEKRQHSYAMYEGKRASYSSHDFFNRISQRKSAFVTNYLAFLIDLSKLSDDASDVKINGLQMVLDHMIEISQCLPESYDQVPFQGTSMLS